LTPSNIRPHSEHDVVFPAAFDETVAMGAVCCSVFVLLTPSVAVVGTSRAAPLA
jgi:hypothetical protein